MAREMEFFLAVVVAEHDGIGSSVTVCMGINYPQKPPLKSKFIPEYFMSNEFDHISPSVCH